ncbi:MAG TPA: hypothetical protein VMK65_01200 [Longimicrobiales bacterium]|nr:hypothetical protein [Longimicrobiales bacterium]
MLRGIVRVLAADRPSLEIVAELDSSEDLAAAATLYRADVVLTSLPCTQAEATAQRILLTHPKLRLLIMSEDARLAHLHLLLPQRMMLNDVSPGELLDAILGTGRYPLVEWRA